MISAKDIILDIQEAIHNTSPFKEKYSKLYAIVKRIVTQESQKLNTDFSGLYSQLYAICQQHGIDYHNIDCFRRNLRKAIIENDGTQHNEKKFLANCARLCLFVKQLYGVSLPYNLEELEIPQSFQYEVSNKNHKIQKLRAIVKQKENNCIYCSTDLGDLYVDISHLNRTLKVLSEGIPVNLIDVTLLSEYRANAKLVIIEPDYLIDVSALTASIKQYGDVAENYFIDLLAPKETTIPILIGNAANKFMDDLVNSTVNLNCKKDISTLYQTSLRNHFIENLLIYACTDLPIQKDFFDKLKDTFINIKNSVEQIFPSTEVELNPEDVLLEPSFICETLGLRGRLDVMALNHKSLVELKSGKAMENYGKLQGPQRAHVLQMSLYKEILHYNFQIPRDQIKSFLFYSRYPVFYNQRTSFEAIKNALELRNEIVVTEAHLRNNQVDSLIKRMNPDTLNVANMTGTLWTKYLMPKLKEITRPLKEMNELEHDYFTHFFTFIEREKYLSKTTDNRLDSTKGLASIWNNDINTKIHSGDILPKLRIIEIRGKGGIESIKFSIPNYGEDFIANFSNGEMVQLYRGDDENCNVTNSQLIRGYIEYISNTEIKIQLAYKQRNKKIFPIHAFYTIEHDGSDAPFSSALRGLYSLLTATKDRKDLLLGQRSPEVSKIARNPIGTWKNATTTEIIKHIKNAEDYFLLVGPPGTGKTSVALKAMVEEFLLERKEHETRCGLMLMAYTNRAVDEICAMLDNIKTKYVRIGAEQTCAEQYRNFLISKQLNNVRNRQDAINKLQDIPIVVGTISTLSNHLELFKLRPYYAIIDEASQVLEPQILGLLCAKDAEGRSAIRKFIMIGDHKQLPAVVLLPPNKTQIKNERLRSIGLTDLRNSLFQRLHFLATKNNKEKIVGMLTKQGRMHPDICKFVSQKFYQGLLDAVPLPHQKENLPQIHSKNKFKSIVLSTRFGFVNVHPSSTSSNPKTNAEEAQIVAKIAHILSQQDTSGEDSFSKRLGIIVPFRNQITMIKKALYLIGFRNVEDVTIDTVECFQGSQRDYIIFSTTIKKTYQLDILSATTEIDGTIIDRKLNVALTRAKLQFFMVGNKELLEKSPIYKELISHMKEIKK